MFYACYQLARRGWNVMPTTRNARGPDILIYSEDGQRRLGIQVKALSKRAAVGLGTKLDSLALVDFFVVCRGIRADAPECFILTPEEVRERVTLYGSSSTAAYWLDAQNYEAEEFRGAWWRIGNGL